MPTVPTVKQLEAAVVAWGIGTYSWQHEGGGLCASARCSELYGWSGPLRADALWAAVLWAAVHADDRARTRRAFEGALDPAGDGRVDLVHRVVRPDGTQVWLHHRAQTHFESRAGRLCPCETIGSVLEVTERWQIEQELRRAETRFEEAVRAAQFGIFEHNHLEDPRAENVYWSPRMREIFGVGADEPGSAARLISRIPAEDVPPLHQAVQRAHAPDGDGYYDVEHRYLHPVLGMRWLLTRSSTHFAEVEGKRVAVRTVGAMLDVTARRMAAEEREQRAQILDAAIDFVAMAEPGGKLVYLNRAARQFLGIGLEEPLGARNLHAAYAPESLQLLLAEGVRTAEQAGAWRSEAQLLRRDGARVPMSHVLLCHRASDGQVALFSTIARDISRERQLEENVRQSQKMEAVGRLAGGIAHDFNNILSAVLSFAHVAARDIGVGGAGHAELQEIIGASERAAALTQQLLAFSRRQVLRPRVVEVTEVLTRLGPMIARLVGEHIEVVVSLAPEPVRVKVDPTHLEQVLLNLAINARDAMESGGHLGIACRLTDVDERLALQQGDIVPGRYAVISVSDDGIGMDGATRARVFEPFFTTKGPGRGTGLGLSTVFGIVKQSGGSLYVRSELGRGSTFEAYMPSTDEPPTEAAPVSSRDYRCGTHRILVVEDDASVRKVVTTVLQHAGYRVLTAPGPDEALSLAAEHAEAIDLLVTDVIMPLMNGNALARRLTRTRPEMAVLYMSGYTAETIVHDGILDEGIHLLPKPFTPERLLEAVGHALNGARVVEQCSSAVQGA